MNEQRQPAASALAAELIRAAWSVPEPTSPTLSTLHSGNKQRWIAEHAMLSLFAIEVAIESLEAVNPQGSRLLMEALRGILATAVSADKDFNAMLVVYPGRATTYRALWAQAVDGTVKLRQIGELFAAFCGHPDNALLIQAGISWVGYSTVGYLRDLRQLTILPG